MKQKIFLKKVYILLLYIVFTCYSSMSQQMVTSEAGQKIKIFDDGTYSILARENEKPVSIAKLPLLDEEEKAVQQLKVIEAEYFVLIYNLQKSVDILQLNLIQAKAEGNSEIIADQKNKIKELRGKIKDSEGLYDNALYNLKLSQKLNDGSEKKMAARKGKILKYIDSKDYIFKSSKLREGDSEQWLAYDPKTFERDISQALEQEYKAKEPVITIEHKKSGTDCEFTEENQGELKTVYPAFASMFFYTPERIKSHLKHENLIQGNCRIKKVNDSHFLELQWIVHSKDAAKSYGHVAEGSLLRIEFVNGIRLNLKAPQTTLGRIEEYSGKVYYQFLFALDKEMLKQLEMLPVDYVGVMWTTGYEKYEVFEVDTLIRQLQCFKNLKK